MKPASGTPEPLVLPSLLVDRPADRFGISRRSEGWSLGREADLEILWLTLDLWGSCTEPAFRRAFGQFPSRTVPGMVWLVQVASVTPSRPPVRVVIAATLEQLLRLGGSVFSVARRGGFDAAFRLLRCGSKGWLAATVSPEPAEAGPDDGGAGRTTVELLKAGAVLMERADRDSARIECQAEAVIEALPVTRRMEVTLYTFCFTPRAETWRDFGPAMAVLHVPGVRECLTWVPNIDETKPISNPSAPASEDPNS